MTKAAIRLLALPVLVGCASLGRPVPQRNPLRLHVNASSGRTWDAVLAYFKRSGLSVDSTDRSSGLIAAQVPAFLPGRSPFGACYGFLDNGYATTNVSTSGGGEFEHSAGGVHFAYNRNNYVGAAITAIVQGDSARTTIDVAAKLIGADAHMSRTRCEISREWEQRFESEIVVKAEKHSSFWHKAER